MPAAGKAGEQTRYFTDANIAARQQLIKHWATFPGKYIPVPNSPTTDMVCRPTHRPPRPRKDAQRINLTPSDSTDASALQPLPSSRMPSKTIAHSDGSSHKNQRCANAIMTRNSITHPHTPDIEVIAFAIACGSDIPLIPVGWIPACWFWGSIFPTSKADMIWIPHRIHTVHRFEKKTPHIPKMNAGPALLQKPRHRLASAVLICPHFHISYTHFAPTGYPPNSPASSKFSDPVGILQKAVNGFKKEIAQLDSAFVKRIEITKKGKSDGITV